MTRRKAKDEDPTTRYVVIVGGVLADDVTLQEAEEVSRAFLESESCPEGVEGYMMDKATWDKLSGD